MFDVCLFAGTTEGRQLALFFQETGLRAYVCVATEYGETLIPQGENIVVHAGRMDKAGMKALFDREKFPLVVDATHPYATLVTENIAAAAAETGTEYVRLLREKNDAALDAVYVGSIDEAAEYLKNTAGNILVTTGSKELLPYRSIPGYEERLYVRVLPMESSLSACGAAGIPPAHIIAMQGPFTAEMNSAIIRMTGAKYLVTKDSGTSGGFPEKIAAAEKEGIIPIVIGRPEERTGTPFEKLIQLLSERYGVQAPTRVSVIGIGMGNPGLLTGEAREALDRAECIIGAKRMVEATANGRPSFVTIDHGKIEDFIRAHAEYREIAVVMSGDTGFYSGAKKLLPLLEEHNLRVYPGISSLQYLCARLRTCWDDVHVISLHGREGSAAAAVAEHRKVFALVGGAGGAARVCEELCTAGLGHVSIAVGERLSYPDEKITEGTAEELRTRSFDPLSVLLIRNKSARLPRRSACLPDEAFLRSTGAGTGVPMTKAEVRAVSIAKLMLEPDSVVYDIGAGTGSVSVEMAGICTRGRIYAVECKPEAAALADKNRKHFGLYNLTIVEGMAPAACAPLPPPTHAFIGGTSGNMREVIAMLLQKNPDVRIVINLIALESIAEAMHCIETFGFSYAEVVQVSVAKAKKLGRYHLMNGQNPITIITLQNPTPGVGETKKEEAGA
ncbi:MAG: precorrin-6A reductase [bacterium]|nr:precorrin-6A reductase [bacterium]